MLRLLVAFAFVLVAPSAPQPQVHVGDRALFAMPAPLGPFSAEERAQAATQRLDRIVKDYSVAAANITVSEQPASTDILAGDTVLLTVTDIDAAVTHTTRQALAQQDLKLIRDGLASVRAEYSSRSLIRGALLALAVTIVFTALLVGMKRLAPRLYRTIEKRRGRTLRGFHFQSLEVISADRLVELLKGAVWFLRVVVTLLLFYFYLPLVLSFFPQTRTYSHSILGYVLDPVAHGWVSFVAYLPHLLVVLVVAAFTWAAVRLNRFLFRELERGTITWSGFYPEWALPTSRILDLLIIAFALVVMFPYLPGSNSPAFKGVTIFLGVLFSLGSTSVVSNIIGGIVLTYARAFRVGDRVQIGDTVGDVVGKTLLATQVRTIKNVNITIPNALVLASHIINFSASEPERPLILHTSVTIGYDSPWRQIHELLLVAAKRTEGLLEDPAPFVLQTALDDFYVGYQINAYTVRPQEMAAIYSALHANIQDAFNEAGVEIMSPHYSALRDGNPIAIPDANKPGGYEAPSFRVRTR